MQEKKEKLLFNRRIKYSLGRTINCGNFESVRIDVEIAADVDPNKNLDDAKEDLFTEVSEELAARCNELLGPTPIRKPTIKKFK
jgi:hypothetical protein